MGATPLIAFILSSVLHKQDAYTFMTEFVGIWVFGFYWLIKTSEISKTKADEMAAHGNFQLREPMNPFKKAEVVRVPAPVTGP